MSGAEGKAEKGLFIVFSPEGNAPPKVIYPTHGKAHAASRIMARRHPGQTFYVMRQSGKPARCEPDPSKPSKTDASLARRLEIEASRPEDDA